MSLRQRLAVLYSLLFLLASGSLLTITYLLVARALPRESLLGDRPVAADGPDGQLRLDLPPAFSETLDEEAAQQRSAALQELVVQSAIALTVTAVLAVVLGWLVAGRVLHPLRHVIEAARRLSPDRLHERIELDRPDDEFKTLAETFNAMLARLEAGFAFQRRFAANASHELRTPLTVQRSAVDVALADPQPSVDSLRRMALKVQKATQRHEQLIDSLLVLARSQEGITRPEQVELAPLAGDMLDEAVSEQKGAGVRVTRELRPAWVMGDRPLLERLVANLVDNAVTHNVPGGWVHVRTGTSRGQAVVEVANSGPEVPAAVVASLFEPFRRHGDRSRADRGVGLGLSIVVAISNSHGGSVHAEPRPDGGLRLSVRLPAAQTTEGGNRPSFSSSTPPPGHLGQ